MDQADLKRFCYMHWHFFFFWIRTKVTTVVSSSFEWFRVLKTCFGMAVRKNIYRKTDKLYSNCQKTSQGPYTPTKPG